MAHLGFQSKFTGDNYGVVPSSAIQGFKISNGYIPSRFSCLISQQQYYLEGIWQQHTNTIVSFKFYVKSQTGPLAFLLPSWIPPFIPRAASRHTVSNYCCSRGPRTLRGTWPRFRHGPHIFPQAEVARADVDGEYDINFINPEVEGDYQMHVYVGGREMYMWLVQLRDARHQRINARKSSSRELTF